MNENKNGFHLNERYAPENMIKLCNAVKLAGTTCQEINADSYSSSLIRDASAFGFLLGVAYSLSCGKELPF